MTKIKANDNIILSENEKSEMIFKLTKKYKEILEILNFDVENDQQIKDTPRRIAKMMVNETLSGCYNKEPTITVFDNTEEVDEMIFLGPISIKSTCSHHAVPFVGEAFLGYIADKKIVGISKLSRIVKWYMRRFQIQEELTKQIANYIEAKLHPLGCGVYIKAQHLCMTTRGVEEPNSYMITSCLKGNFKNYDTRLEFLNMIKK